MLWLAVLLTGCLGDHWCSASGTGLGTSWRARWVGMQCAPVRTELEDRIQEVEGHLGVWVDDSEVQAVRTTVGAVVVSEETFDAVRFAIDLAGASEGAFDPTVEPLVRAWGFHTGDGTPVRPDADTLADAMARVDWQRVRLGRGPDGPWIDSGGTALDLTAILEGHAADRLSVVLSRRGITQHLVDVGGEVRVAGEGPRGLWRLPLDVPADHVAADWTLSLTNAALATAHRGPDVLDPTTGLRSTSDVDSVAVVAPDARVADGLATAAALLGAARGSALLEGWPDVEGVVFPVAGDPDMTSGMSAFLARSPTRP